MIVYEFYLKENFKNHPFEVLCQTFYNVGPAFSRKVDGQNGKAVYGVSRNPRSHWVQLLVDDNSPESALTVIEARINGLMSEWGFDCYPNSEDHVAPPERQGASAPSEWGRRREEEKGLMARIRSALRRLKG